MTEYVIFVHGIGRQQPGSYARFEQRVESEFRRAVAELDRPDGEFYWKTMLWSDLTDPIESEFEANLPVGGLFHHFMIQYVADAVAYAARHHWPGLADRIQARFIDALEEIQAHAESRSGTGNLTVIGHSIGSLILLDSLEAAIENQFMPKRVQLKRLVTLGSPVSLYASLFGLQDVMNRSNPTVWLNLFYPQDPIGYPLMMLSGVRNRVVREVALSPRAGVKFWRGIGRSILARVPVLGPVLSHTWYFTDRVVAHNIGQLLAGRWDSQIEATGDTQEAAPAANG